MDSVVVVIEQCVYIGGSRVYMCGMKYDGDDVFVMKNEVVLNVIWMPGKSDR